MRPTLILAVLLLIGCGGSSASDPWGSGGPDGAAGSAGSAVGLGAPDSAPPITTGEASIDAGQILVSAPDGGDEQIVQVEASAPTEASAEASVVADAGPAPTDAQADLAVAQGPEAGSLDAGPATVDAARPVVDAYRAPLRWPLDCGGGRGLEESPQWRLFRCKAIPPAVITAILVGQDPALPCMEWSLPGEHGAAGSVSGECVPSNVNGMPLDGSPGDPYSAVCASTTAFAANGDSRPNLYLRCQL